MRTGVRATGLLLAGAALVAGLAAGLGLAVPRPAGAAGDARTAPWALVGYESPGRAAGLPADLAAEPAAPEVPTGPLAPTSPVSPGNGTVTVNVPGQPSQVLQIILLVTVLGVAPALLLLCTSFTKIVVVLSLTRSALGTPSIPPNQVLVGLALFLSLFVMGPTVDQIQKQAITPYGQGRITTVQAYRAGTGPLQTFMLAHTRDADLALMTKAAGEPLPKQRADVQLRTLIPAFVLSELRGAFIIGFVIFIPFLVIDVVVSAILMSLGMVMLPPSLVSLPFKLLLFVLVDGWSLIITTLLRSYH